METEELVVISLTAFALLFSVVAIVLLTLPETDNSITPSDNTIPTTQNKSTYNHQMESDSPDITHWEGVISGYVTHPDDYYIPFIADTQIDLQCGESNNPYLNGITCEGDVKVGSSICQLDGYHAFPSNWTGVTEYGDCLSASWNCNEQTNRIFISIGVEGGFRISGGGINLDC